MATSTHMTLTAVEVKIGDLITLRQKRRYSDRGPHTDGTRRWFLTQKKFAWVEVIIENEDGTITIHCHKKGGLRTDVYTATETIRVLRS